MEEFDLQVNESETIKDSINGYICNLKKYLEMDYELQDYIFKGFEIKHIVKQTIEYTEIILAFPNDFVYSIRVNLNIDDLPDFIGLAVNIKYMIMK